MNNLPASLLGGQVKWYLDGTDPGPGHTRTITASTLGLGPHTFTVTGTDDTRLSGSASLAVNVV